MRYACMYRKEIMLYYGYKNHNDHSDVYDDDIDDDYANDDDDDNDDSDVLIV